MRDITNTVYSTYAMPTGITPGIIKIIADAERDSVTPIEERKRLTDQHYQEIKKEMKARTPQQDPVGIIEGIYSKLVELVSSYFTKSL